MAHYITVHKKKQYNLRHLNNRWFILRSDVKWRVRRKAYFKPEGLLSFLVMTGRSFESVRKFIEENHI